MILITTSRRPTRIMRTLCRDLADTIPSIRRVNRGKMSIFDIGEKAIGIGADKVLIIDRWKGRPGRMRLFEVKENLSQIPPQLYIRGVKFRRDFESKKRKGSPYPRRVFIEESEKISPDVKKLCETFSRFFNLPIVKSNRMDESRSFTVMRLSLDPENLIRVSFYLMPKNIEVGPRIRISHAVWEI